MTIKETRLISRYDLQEWCCQNEYFTKGTNEEYSVLLNLTEKDITPKVLYVMAEMIFRYSDFEGDFETNEGAIQYIMHGLSKIAYSLFKIIR